MSAWGKANKVTGDDIVCYPLPTPNLTPDQTDADCFFTALPV